MRQLLNSDLELFVESDFIYLPLLFDPEIEKETQALLQSGRAVENSGETESKIIVKIKDIHFIKTMKWLDIVQLYTHCN